MLGSLFSFAAARFAGDAVDGLARRALWGGLAAILLLTGFIFGLMILFWVFEPQYGAVPVASVIAGASIGAALIALTIPPLTEWMKKRRTASALSSSNPVAQTVAAVSEETEAAVDYFGAVQVVASAFMFGLGAARQIRRR